MSDDKTNVGGADRARVAGDEEYEVRYFAQKHGISVERAQDLIDKHGNNREALEAAAKSLK